ARLGDLYNDSVRNKSRIFPTRHAPVAQWIEHQTTDLRVGGSTPSGRTIFKMSEQAGLQEVKACLARARSVTVLTGAGISADSGVPTFRGADGLWKNFR